MFRFAKFRPQRYKNNCKTKQYIAIICVYLCFFQRKDRFWQAKEVFLSYPFELGTTNYDRISHRKLTIGLLQSGTLRSNGVKMGY